MKLQQVIIVSIAALIFCVAAFSTQKAKAYDKSALDMLVKDLKKQLPNLTAPQISESPVPGLYEIVAGDQIFYWTPTGHLFMGEIFNVKEGKSITAAKKEAVRAERDKGLATKIAALPLDKAVKIGNGKNTIIEFTDPDCPFCRKVDEFLSKRNDVTRYVFLFPLKKIHPKAAEKSAWILSQKEKATAPSSVFAGSFDASAVPSFFPDALAVVEENLQLGAKLGITGTPVLIVNGSIVRGADINRLKLLLESNS